MSVVEVVYPDGIRRVHPWYKILVDDEERCIIECYKQPKTEPPKTSLLLPSKRRKIRKIQLSSSSETDDKQPKTQPSKTSMLPNKRRKIRKIQLSSSSETDDTVISELKTPPSTSVISPILSSSSSSSSSTTASELPFKLSSPSSSSSSLFSSSSSLFSSSSPLASLSSSLALSSSSLALSSSSLALSSSSLAPSSSCFISSSSSFSLASTSSISLPSSSLYSSSSSRLSSLSSSPSAPFSSSLSVSSSSSLSSSSSSYFSSLSSSSSASSPSSSSSSFLPSSSSSSSASQNSSLFAHRSLPKAKQIDQISCLTDDDDTPLDQIFYLTDDQKKPLEQIMYLSDSSLDNEELDQRIIHVYVGNLDWDEKEKHPRDVIDWSCKRQKSAAKSTPFFVRYNERGCAIQRESKARHCEIVCIVDRNMVVSKYHPGFVMVKFFDDKANVEAYAPGHVEEIDFGSGDDAEPRARFSWLKEDKEFLQMSTALGSVCHASSLLAEDTHWMPLDSVCAPLSHIPQKAQERYMPKYKYILNEYIRHDPNDFGFLKPQLQTGDDQPDGLTLFDMLEFHHVSNTRLWRTTMGTHIYGNFIAFAMEFGGKSRVSMVTQLLTTSFLRVDKRSHSECERGTCEACGKAQVITHTLKFAHDELRVGCVCAVRMRYIYDIGQVIQRLRTTALTDFDLTDMKMCLENLHALRDTFRRHEALDKQYFSSSFTPYF